MLALYDVDDNGLRRSAGTLNHADLYEQILRRFAEREIRKTRPELAGGPLAEEIENELLRLSIAGFATFNRGRQWVTDDELSADLTALPAGPVAEGHTRGFHLPPTPAQQVIDFLRPLTGRLDERRRRLLRELLLVAFHGALDPHRDTAHDAYQPCRLSVPARHAAYSANLLLLITVIGGPVRGRELFPDAGIPAAEWRRLALLWRSQFTPEAWGRLAGALALERTWYRGDREVLVSLREEESWTAPSPTRSPGSGWAPAGRTAAATWSGRTRTACG